MRLSDDFDDKNAGLPVIYVAIGVSVFTLVILGVVLLLNKKDSKNGMETAKKNAVLSESEQETDFSDDPYLSGSTITSDQLDFWHMYDTVEEETVTEEEKKKEEEEKKEDPSTDGKHTKLVAEDGTEEWVSINPYLTKNTYDYSNLVYQYPIMKYYEDSEKVSKVGVHISADDGDVNFRKLKKAGIDFAMIRLGSRGYGSGNLMADEMFYENMRKATEADMDVGVTFFSQAITKEEALEEATRVIEGLQGFSVVYPVVFDMEYIKNDTARVQGISKDVKTEVAVAFMDAVKQAGYNPMLYGDKEWLIRKVDLSKLVGYDVWLSQEQDVPDYPYKYTMWEYTKNAKLNGMDEPAQLSVCFIDYGSK